MAKVVTELTNQFCNTTLTGGLVLAYLFPKANFPTKQETNKTEDRKTTLKGCETPKEKDTLLVNEPAKKTDV